MSNVTYVWHTLNAENLIAKMGRVSNKENENNTETAPRLLRYLAKNKHWSPFEMANLCLEIETTRDIARQILRHRSFSFQEFSQRYAEVTDSDFEIFEARLQDLKNRQSSLETDDEEIQSLWSEDQLQVIEVAYGAYKRALASGIAKEVARKVLPEGLTPSRMYMNGTLRSWIHYLKIRLDPSTQKEHREVAEQVRTILVNCYPTFKEFVSNEALFEQE